MPVRSTPEPEQTSKQMPSCCTPQFFPPMPRRGGPPNPRPFYWSHEESHPVGSQSADPHARPRLICPDEFAADSVLPAGSRSQLASSFLPEQSCRIHSQARCTGIRAASKPNRAIVTIVPPSTSGPHGVARYTICANTRLAITPSSNPTAEPDSSKTRGRPSAEPIRWTGWAEREREINFTHSHIGM